MAKKNGSTETTKRNTKPTVGSTAKYLKRIGSDPKLLAEALASISQSEGNVIVALAKVAGAEASKRVGEMKKAAIAQALEVGVTPDEIAAATGGTPRNASSHRAQA